MVSAKMVVNKLQRGFSWDSYVRSANVAGDSAANWPLNEHGIGTESARINEPLVEWKNTFNMRQVTLENIAESVNENHNAKVTVKAVKMHGRNVVNAAKSLDLLRQNIQSAINNDIDRVIKKYLDMYFVPAINNIRNNLGQASVNEEHVREVCRTMLDEAKHLYLNSPLSRSDSPFNAALDTSTLIESRFGNSQGDSEVDNIMQMHAQKRKSNVNVVLSSNKHDPNRIHSKTLFITSSRVNKILAHTGARSKLFSENPDLFRYPVDPEDRDWLMRHKLHYVTVNSPPNPLYVMVLDDIRELLSSECYRNNPNLHLHELKGFEAPEFMMKKIRSLLTTHSFVDFVDNEDCSSQYDVNTIQAESPSVNICTRGETNSNLANVNNQNQEDITDSNEVIESTNVLIQETVTLENVLDILKTCETPNDSSGNVCSSNNIDLVGNNSSIALKELLSRVNQVISINNNN